MRFEYIGFEWDEGNRVKCAKHGVSREEIEYVFASDPVLLLPDIAHSDSEERLIVIGMTAAGRHIFVAFTLGEGPQGILIRPVSARYMHRKEIDRYAQEGPAAPLR